MIYQRLILFKYFCDNWTFCFSPGQIEEYKSRKTRVVLVTKATWCPLWSPDCVDHLFYLKYLIWKGMLADLPHLPTQEPTFWRNKHKLWCEKQKATQTFLRMSSANVRKAFSMLMLALALVSKNLMPCSLAIYEHKQTNKKQT